MERWRETRRDLGGRSQDVSGRNGRYMLTDEEDYLCAERERTRAGED